MLAALCERHSVEVAALNDPLVANSFEAWRLQRLKDIAYSQSNCRSPDQLIAQFRQCQTSTRTFMWLCSAGKSCDYPRRARDNGQLGPALWPEAFHAGLYSAGKLPEKPNCRCRYSRLSHPHHEMGFLRSPKLSSLSPLLLFNTTKSKMKRRPLSAVAALTTTA